MPTYSGSVGRQAFGVAKGVSAQREQLRTAVGTQRVLPHPASNSLSPSPSHSVASPRVAALAYARRATASAAQLLFFRHPPALQHEVCPVSHVVHSEGPPGHGGKGRRRTCPRPDQPVTAYSQSPLSGPHPTKLSLVLPVFAWPGGPLEWTSCLSSWAQWSSYKWSSYNAYVQRECRQTLPLSDTR